MSLQSFIEKNRSAVVVVALVVLIVAIAILITRSGGTRTLDGYYFYDLSTGALFTQPMGTMPPVATEAGADQGVRAFVMTCASCDADERFIAYLTTLPEQVKQQIESGQTGNLSPGDLEGYNLLIATPPASGESPVWVKYNAPAGEAIRKKVMGRCTGRQPTACHP